MIKFKSSSSVLWCPKCGTKEEIKTLTTVQSSNKSSKVINKDSISIFSRCEANCTCGTEMLELDPKFVDVFEKLRYLGVIIIDTGVAYTMPYRDASALDDTYCSGAYVTVVLDHGQDSLHPAAFSETCSFNEECAELGTISIDEDRDKGGILISSSFDLTEGKCSAGFVNKEDVGGDEKLKKYCEISDDRLLRFLNDFIKNIEGD